MLHLTIILKFPHIKQIYCNSGMDVIPSIKTWILDTIEEVVSDTLVDPGRFLIDLSKQPPQTKMITGVRKLKRTALNIQVSL